MHADLKRICLSIRVPDMDTIKVPAIYIGWPVYNCNLWLDPERSGVRLALAVHTKED